MKLREWLKREGISVREFAKRIGEPDSIVRKWVYGQRQPSLRKAVLIGDHTAGEVTTTDLLIGQATALSAMPTTLAMPS